VTGGRGGHALYPWAPVLAVTPLRKGSLSMIPGSGALHHAVFQPTIFWCSHCQSPVSWHNSSPMVMILHFVTKLL